MDATPPFDVMPPRLYYSSRATSFSEAAAAATATQCPLRCASGQINEQHQQHQQHHSVRNNKLLDTSDTGIAVRYSALQLNAFHERFQVGLRDHHHHQQQVEQSVLQPKKRKFAAATAFTIDAILSTSSNIDARSNTANIANVSETANSIHAVQSKCLRHTQRLPHEPLALRICEKVSPIVAAYDAQSFFLFSPIVDTALMPPPCLLHRQRHKRRKEARSWAARSIHVRANLDARGKVRRNTLPEQPRSQRAV